MEKSRQKNHKLCYIHKNLSFCVNWQKKLKKNSGKVCRCSLNFVFFSVILIKLCSFIIRRKAVINVYLGGEEYELQEM